MKQTAKVFSIIFHPMLLTTYATLLMFIFPTYLSLYPYNFKKAITLIIFSATFVSPLLVLLILLNLRKIDSLHLQDKKERTLPLFIALIMYLSAWLISLNFPGGMPAYFSYFILSSLMIIFTVSIITLRYKISVHMAGLGGFIGFFYIWFLKMNISPVLFIFSGFHFLTIHFFALLFLIAGITASARMILKSHNPGQIISGFFLGLVLGLASVVLY